MSRIVVLGDLNLDVLASLPKGIIKGGEVRTVVRVAPGGSAGTFARIAAREGATVTFIGCVGDDLAGELLIRSLQDEGVDPQVKRVDAPTGVVISLGEAQERTMLCSRGANDGIDPSWVDKTHFRGACHLHLSGYSLLSSSQREAAHKAMEIAQAFGMTISLDPPPVNLIRAFGVTAFLREAATADWLFPNLDEGRTLSGEEIPEKVVSSLASTFSVGALTLGKEGALAWKGVKRDRLSLEEIDVADSTGAGDAFAAGFVAAYLKSKTLSIANRRANEVAWQMLKARKQADSTRNHSPSRIDLKTNPH